MNDKRSRSSSAACATRALACTCLEPCAAAGLASLYRRSRNGARSSSTRLLKRNANANLQVFASRFARKASALTSSTTSAAKRTAEEILKDVRSGSSTCSAKATWESTAKALESSLTAAAKASLTAEWVKAGIAIGTAVLIKRLLLLGIRQDL